MQMIQLAPTAAKLGGSQPERRYIPRSTASRAHDFSSGSSLGKHYHASNLWMLGGVTLRAKNLDVARFISQFWMRGVRHLMVTVEVMDRPTILALSLLSDDISYHGPRSVTSPGDAPAPIRMIFSSWCGAMSGTLARAIFHLSGAVFTALKAAPTLLALRSEDGRPLLRPEDVRALTRAAKRKRSNMGWRSAKSSLTHWTLERNLFRWSPHCQQILPIG